MTTSDIAAKERLISDITALAVANDIEITIELDAIKHYLAINLSTRDTHAFLRILRDDEKMRFTTLIDIFGADFLDRMSRFEIVYNLLSLKLNQRIFLKTNIQENDKVRSISDLFMGAVWYEREVFDMYGVTFEHLSDHRRILTDYGFEWHPLRKDFPLTGYTQVRYDEKQKKVIYEPVNLEQEYRNFDFTSPWTGPNYDIKPNNPIVTDPAKTALAK